MTDAGQQEQCSTVTEEAPLSVRDTWLLTTSLLTKAVTDIEHDFSADSVMAFKPFYELLEGIRDKYVGDVPEPLTEQYSKLTERLGITPPTTPVTYTEAEVVDVLLRVMTACSIDPDEIEQIEDSQ